jgi:hypothetical protein
VDGAAPPSLVDYTPGVGAWLESGQTITNSYNFSLEVVAERSTSTIAVYRSGDIVPSKYRDNRLQMLLGSHAEQAIYFGCYRVFAQGERPALTVAQMGDIYKTYLPVYPRLRFDSDSLQFLTIYGFSFVHTACIDWYRLTIHVVTMMGIAI